MGGPRGWHHRGYLPHFDGGEVAQFVSFRVADTRRGACLSDSHVAQVVEDALSHFDGERYRLHAWVIMPDHVHVLFTPKAGYRVSEIIHSWKSFSSKRANGILGTGGKFWHEDYFDRYIRNQPHFDAALEYIKQNPVKANLCQSPEHWPYLNLPSTQTPRHPTPPNQTPLHQEASYQNPSHSGATYRGTTYRGTTYRGTAGVPPAFSASGVPHTTIPPTHPENKDLTNLREEYKRSGLEEKDLAQHPIEQFRRWFDEALEANLHEPNAMTLATATSYGKPSARVVLLKGYDERGFVFYTNYEGRKAVELQENPYVALVFYWGELERQLRIEGCASRVSASESDAYHWSRPRGSQLGAWASEQSRMVEGREVLEDRLRNLEAEYEGRDVPRPPFWGGYRVEPEAFEFWQGRENRLHDRLVYRRAEGGWEVKRLQP